MIILHVSHQKKGDLKTVFLEQNYSDKELCIICLFALYNFTELPRILNQHLK